MSDEEPEEQAPRPARKVKKKRRDAPAPEPSPAKAEDEGERDAAGEADPAAQRPAFAARFPNDPALNDLVSAFEQGNYALVRREAPALAKRTDRPEVRKAARELARRIDPDPLAVYMLIAAVLLLVFLAAWYWSHPHEAPL